MKRLNSVQVSQDPGTKSCFNNKDDDSDLNAHTQNISYKYQFILITVTEERRKKIIEQFNEMNISAPLFCLEIPSIVSNSTDYFPDHISEFNKKIVCCTRDHIRALELSAKDESPEFSIIIEDDVAFHKTKFIDGINEIMNNWAKITGQKSSKMVSVGWVPCNKYDSYVKIDPMYKFDSIHDAKICGDRYVVGTQAYIVRKDDIKSETALFGHHTFDSLRKSVNLIKRDNLGSADCIEIDRFINKVFQHMYVFPPLAIEQDVKSTLRSYSQARSYWINFYNGCEDYIKDYWSFNIRMSLKRIDCIQLINLSGNKCVFNQTNPCMDGKYESITVVNDSNFEITPNIKYLFRNNAFDWDVEKLGRAFAHYKIWCSIAAGEKGNTVLILENNVVLNSDFIEKWNSISEDMSVEAGLIYIGGVSSENKPHLIEVTEPINRSFARVKASENKICNKLRRFEFDAYSYIITRVAAIKICHVIDNLGFLLSLDILLMNLDNLVTIHFANPLLCNKLPNIEYTQ